MYKDTYKFKTTPGETWCGETGCDPNPPNYYCTWNPKSCPPGYIRNGIGRMFFYHYLFLDS
jgi:hypothetical protein